MIDLCAPFTLVSYEGQDWIARDGIRQRVAPVELVYTMNGGAPENGISYQPMPWGEVWGFTGGWYDDPDLILSVVGALKLRAERLREAQQADDNST